MAKRGCFLVICIRIPSNPFSTTFTTLILPRLSYPLFTTEKAFWLAHWAREALKGEESGVPLTDAEVRYYLNGYALFGMLGVLWLTTRSVCMAYHRMRASRALHVELTDAIMKAPVSYFDVTPTGRILNRFAADVSLLN